MEYRLKDCLEKVIDNRGKNPNYFDKEKYPVIDNVFIKNNYYINDKIVNRYINQETYDNFLRGYVEENMPIMTLVGSGIGNVGLIKNENVAIVQNTIGFKTKENLDPKYLYYWFLTKQDELQSFNRGSGQPSIKKTDVENMEIDLPDIAIQKKIVYILEKLDDKIYLNDQINDNLYELIKIQYNKFINNIDEFELVKLKDIANVSSGKRPKIKGNEFDIPLIGASGVMAYTDNYNINEDILIIGRVGTLGVVQRYFDKIWASDNTLTIKTEYGCTVECYLKTVDYISLNRGSTQPLITQTDISNLVIKFNKVNFEEFEKQIRPLRYKIYKNELQNKTLEQIRDTLLPKLMNGEIELDKIEI